LTIKDNKKVFKKDGYLLKKYKFENLKLDTKYLIQVRCKTGLHYSKYCNILSFKTKKMIDDKWDPLHCGPGLTIEGKLIRKTNTAHRTVLLTKTVDANSKSKHVWKFEMIYMPYSSGAWNPFIGIWKMYQYGKTLRGSPKNTYITSSVGQGYAYISYNNQGNKNNVSSSSLIPYGKSMVTGDKITMILDMKKLTLSFKHNNKSYGKAFDVERTTYKAGISMYTTGNQIKFLSYQTD